MCQLFRWYKLIQCCRSQQDYADFHQLSICPKVNEKKIFETALQVFLELSNPGHLQSK